MPNDSLDPGQNGRPPGFYRQMTSSNNRNLTEKRHVRHKESYKTPPHRCCLKTNQLLFYSIKRQLFSLFYLVTLLSLMISYQEWCLWFLRVLQGSCDTLVTEEVTADSKEGTVETLLSDRPRGFNPWDQGQIPLHLKWTGAMYNYYKLHNVAISISQKLRCLQYRIVFYTIIKLSFIFW